MCRSAHKILFLVLVAICLQFLQNASVHAEGSFDVPADKIKRFANIKDTVTTYQLGLKNVLGDIPEDIYDTSHHLYQLSLLNREVYKRLYWGYIKPDNHMISLGSGETSGAWAVVYSFDHPELSKRGNTFTAIRLNNISHIKIRPDMVSQRWAGIFMVHEMSHLLEYLNYGETDDESTEYYAYDCEKRLLNYLTKDKFDKALDLAISKYKLETHKQLYAMRENNAQLFLPMFREIESFLKEPPVLSIPEREMRDGFYLMSLYLRIGELRKINQYTRIRKMNSWLNTFRKFKPIMSDSVRR